MIHGSLTITRQTKRIYSKRNLYFVSIYKRSYKNPQWSYLFTQNCTRAAETLSFESKNVKVRILAFYIYIFLLYENIVTLKCIGVMKYAN